MSAGPLAGRRIAVTRPLPQADGLAQGVRAAGGEPVLLPAIVIRDPEDWSAFDAVAARLAEFDWAIFVSPTAVRRAVARLAAVRAGLPWPSGTRVAAIGAGTQRALREAGFAEITAPAGAADSEALLALGPFVQADRLRILVVRGVGGRELLAETLRARGASVVYAECYARGQPEPIPLALRAPAVDAVTVSSAEGLANLARMLDDAGRETLRHVPLFVPHRRVAEEAGRLGVQSVIVAGPSDQEMIASLVAYFGSKRGD